MDKGDNNNTTPWEARSMLDEAEKRNEEDMLRRCWLHETCGSCVGEKRGRGCGWCGSVSFNLPLLIFHDLPCTIISPRTQYIANLRLLYLGHDVHTNNNAITPPLQSHICLPLPATRVPLLHPILHPHPSPSSICPTYDDRWDLRTRTLGCHVNTLTVFSILVTVVATLVTFALGWVLWKTVSWVVGNWGLGSGKAGWEIRILEGGRVGTVWRRGDGWWMLVSKWFEMGRKGARGRSVMTAGERRALLER